jgi:RyR domain
MSQGREPWVPRPVDTSDVSLPPELLELIEMLAENAHDNWGVQRIADKWSHGPERDDKARKHPLLVPYSELPESEKAYDRRLATETLKVIIKLGYRVTTLSSSYRQ